MRALTRQDEESKMVRNVFGSLIALIGATAVVWSPFRAWYDGRHGRDVRIDDLFTGWDGGPDTDVALLRSLLLPMLCAALFALLGLALRVRLLVALAGLVALGFTVLWMVRQGQAAGNLVVDGEGNGLGVGVAGALGGSILLLIAAPLMTKRPTRRVDGAPRPVPRDDVRTHGAHDARAAFHGRYDGAPGPATAYGAADPYGRGVAGTYGAAQGHGSYGGGTAVGGGATAGGSTAWGGGRAAPAPAFPASPGAGARPGTGPTPQVTWPAAPEAERLDKTIEMPPVTEETQAAEVRADGTRPDGGPAPGAGADGARPTAESAPPPSTASPAEATTPPPAAASPADTGPAGVAPDGADPAQTGPSRARPAEPGRADAVPPESDLERTVPQPVHRDEDTT
ncbi:hypothetical protein ACMA1D_06365 [Streptomyces sp. 796.1]|uniref:hypothetical protein n=1 Tax=Streptomyces sp. 796.1 TaxID=3163029 RepID=UPI0039C983B1